MIPCGARKGIGRMAKDRLRFLWDSHSWLSPHSLGTVKVDSQEWLSYMNRERISGTKLGHVTLSRLDAFCENVRR